MVHRIVAKPAGRVQYFARAWAMFAFFILLVSFAIEWLCDAPREGEYLELALVLLLAAAVLAWLSVRAWARYGWFTGGERESFFTVVQEGVLVEVPAKGMSMYLPWKGLTYHVAGDMLLLRTKGALRLVVCVGGIPRQKRAAILADLRRFSGGRQARSGLFAAEQAAAPFAPSAGKEGLPPLPPVLLRPPAPVAASSYALFSNTPAQWREWQRFAQRPDGLVCALMVLCVAVLSVAGGLLWESEWESSLFMLLFALFLVGKLVLPGRRQRSVPGPIRMELSGQELIERWNDGSWARFRLPAADGATLVRLPHVWSMQRRQELGSFLFDAGQELPPQLAGYRREPAPGNGVRGALAAGVMVLCAGLGLLATQAFLGSSREVERAFRELLAQPDAAALRAFADEHVSMGTVYGTPRLEPVTLPEVAEPVSYVLSFTESAPEDEEMTESHYAWETRVFFHPDGEMWDYESEPAAWCPCGECTAYRLEQLTGGE